MIAGDELITYEEVIVESERKFSGAEYRRKLQVKLQGLVFTKGKNINTFTKDLVSTIKRIYNIRDMDIVRQIALNHVTSNLEESLRTDAKVFQLSGNDSIENLLEFLETKMSANALHVEASASIYNNNCNNSDRISKLEIMMEKIIRRQRKLAVIKERKHL